LQYGVNFVCILCQIIVVVSAGTYTLSSGIFSYQYNLPSMFYFVRFEGITVVF
jgi:hypothetical protein